MSGQKGGVYTQQNVKECLSKSLLVSENMGQASIGVCGAVLILLPCPANSQAITRFLKLPKREENQSLRYIQLTGDVEYPVSRGR